MLLVNYFANLQQLLLLVNYIVHAKSCTKTGAKHKLSCHLNLLDQDINKILITYVSRLNECTGSWKLSIKVMGSYRKLHIHGWDRSMS